jgi:hypothetical protein
MRLSQENRYPEQLRSILQEQYKKSGIEVFNAGMDWYTTKHSLINYVTNMRDYNPDLVIIMHAVNDLYRSFSPTDLAVEPYNRLWSHFYGPSINGAKPPTFEQYWLTKFFLPGIREEETWSGKFLWSVSCLLKILRKIYDDWFILLKAIMSPYS